MRSRSGMTDRPGRALALALVLGLAACASTASAGGPGVPDARMGTPVAPILLLSRPDVREDLKLGPDQAVAAEDAISDLHDRALALRGQSGAKADAARREIDRASQAWMAGHLAPDQRRRLDQVALQWEGPAALLRPIVAESLNLSPEQRTALAKAVVERNTRRNDGPPVAADEARLADSAASALSPAQLQGWRSMTGPPCAFRLAAKAGPVRR